MSSLKSKTRGQRHGLKEVVEPSGNVRVSPLQASSVSLKLGLKFGGLIPNGRQVPSPAQSGWIGPRIAPVTSTHLCLTRENLGALSTQIRV
jgi:hypothetical protein